MGISPYVARIREHLGSDLLLLPCVTLLVENDAGKIMMVRNTGNDVWSTMGGMVEPTEHPKVAAVREAKEETNLDVEVTELVTVCGGPECVIVYPNGDQVSYVTTVYRAKLVGGAETPDQDEISEIGWFSPTELADLEMDRFANNLLGEIGLLTPVG